MAKSVFFIVIVLLSVNSHAKTMLKCAFQDTDNFPYQIGSSTRVNKPRPGIAVEMVKLLEKELGISVVLTRLPWKRAEQSLRENLVDCLFDASFKEKRLVNGHYPMLGNKVDITKRSYFNVYSLYALQDSLLVWNGKKLISSSAKPVAGQSGFSIIESLKQDDIKVYEADSLRQMMNLLLNERVIALATFELVGDAFLRKYAVQYAKIKKLKPAFKQKAYYLMLSHSFVENNPILSLNIWNSIERIRNSEKFNVIIEQYAQ